MRNKKILAIFLAVAIFVTCMPAYASAPEQEPEIVTVLAEGPLNDVEGADIVQIAYENLHLIADEAKDLIDNGALLFISAPQDSIENISLMLSIPKNDVSIYSDSLDLLAYSIYRSDSCYVFQQHYALYSNTMSQGENVIDDGIAAYEESDSELRSGTLDNALTVLLADSNVQQRIDNSVETAYRAMLSACEFESEVYAPTVSTRSASLPALASRANTKTLDVYSDAAGTNRLGYLMGTQYIYDLGYGMIDGEEKFVYNVVSKVVACPINRVVEKYKVRMHCNITNHFLLDVVQLPSGVNYNQNVTIGGNIAVSPNPTEGLGGGASVSSSTGWSYNPESQRIDRTSPGERIFEWTATTVKPTKDKSYDITPAIQVATTNGKGQRGAFTTMYCNATLFGVSIRDNSIEFGTWF